MKSMNDTDLEDLVAATAEYRKALIAHRDEREKWLKLEDEAEHADLVLNDGTAPALYLAADAKARSTHYLLNELKASAQRLRMCGGNPNTVEIDA